MAKVGQFLVAIDSMPPFDVSHVLSLCLTVGMTAVAKELEQAAGTPVNAGGDDSAGTLPSAD